MPTPTQPPISASQTIGLGLAAIPVNQPSSTIYIGTIATISAAKPESIYSSEIVTPPLPASSKHAPMIRDVRQFAQLDLLMPCDQAIAYMIRPASTNRAPAIRNGGIVSIAKRIPR